MVNTLFLPELREMLESQNHEEMREFCNSLHAATTAEFMEGLNAEELWQVLAHAESGTRNQIFLYLKHERQIELINGQDRREIARLIAEMSADDRVDILKDADPQVVTELLQLVPSEDRKEILRLQSYPEGTAGAVMTTEIAKLHETLTIASALQEIQRQSATYETIYYLYVVDDSDRLLGLVSARQLISSLGKPDRKITDLMESELITVDVDDDQGEVAQKVAKYDLLAIPVVDHQHRLLGIITYDDVIDVVREEAVRDAHRISAVDPLDESYMRTDLITMCRKRGLWLGLLFLFALLTTYKLHSYEAHLNVWSWLVFFIPLVISTGGNSGSQSATLIITALVSEEIALKDWPRIVRRELVMGLMLGGTLGLFGLILGWFVLPADITSRGAILVLPITLVLVVSCGTFLGSVLPLVFQRLGWDPALMSNPFVSGLIDIVGIVVYFNVARLLLSNGG